MAAPDPDGSRFAIAQAYTLRYGGRMEIRVDCAPGLEGELEPAVVWFGARRVDVQAILDRWYAPGRRWWKLGTGEGVYILRREEGSGAWDLAAVARD